MDAAAVEVCEEMAQRCSKPSSAGSGESMSRRRTAALKRMGNSARQNLREMFESSDSPEELRQSLLVMAEDPKLTFAMLRFGWEKTMSIRRERAASEGLVGALIFSVALQMAVTRLDTSDLEGHVDWWTPCRPVFEDLYYIMITLAATFSAISVVNSCLYMMWIQIYVSDADDFIWFCRKYHVTVWVDAPMVLALLCSIFGIAFATVAIHRDIAASCCFFSILALLAVTLIMFIVGVLPGEQRMKDNFASFRPIYADLIEEAADAATEAILSPAGSPQKKASREDSADSSSSRTCKRPVMAVPGPACMRTLC